MQQELPGISCDVGASAFVDSPFLALVVAVCSSLHLDPAVAI